MPLTDMQYINGWGERPVLRHKAGDFFRNRVRQREVMEMQIRLSSGDYSIVSSGQTFLFGLDKNLKITFIADDDFEFSVILEFKNDLYGEYKIDKRVDGKTVILTCFNFDDVGTGLTKPIRIARMEGKEVFLMFWSYLEGSEKGRVRSVKYTVFTGNHSGEYEDEK